MANSSPIRKRDVVPRRFVKDVYAEQVQKSINDVVGTTNYKGESYSSTDKSNKITSVTNHPIGIQSEEPNTDGIFMSSDSVMTASDKFNEYYEKSSQWSNASVNSDLVHYMENNPAFGNSNSIHSTSTQPSLHAQPYRQTHEKPINHLKGSGAKVV